MVKEGASPHRTSRSTSSEGGEVALAALRGKTVVLYFYPRDMTPGCTREACEFRDTQAPLKKAGAVVLGVSPDSLGSHDKFRQGAQAELPAPLRPRQDGGEEVRGLGREGDVRQEGHGHDPVHVRDRRRGRRAQGLPAGQGGRPCGEGARGREGTGLASPAVAEPVVAEFEALERTLAERHRQVEATLRRLSPTGRSPPVAAAIEDSLFAPAKRLRPILALLVADDPARRSRGCAARGLRHRDGSHREPHPRRSSLHGRRGDPPRAAGQPRGPRRGQRHPRRVRPPEPRLRDPGRGLARRARRRHPDRASRGSWLGPSAWTE